MASSQPDSLIGGLLLPMILLVIIVLAMRRSSKKKPVFNPCPICKENIQFSLGFQRGMRSHFKAAHQEYWRWLRKWVVINTVVMLTGVISIFPLLYYNIIPARPTATPLTPIGIAIWAAVTFSAMGVGVAHQYRGRHGFREEWSEKHPFQERTYGNLGGIEVQLKDIHGKLRTALSSGIEFLFNPIAAILLNATDALLKRKARNTKLDKYQDGRLWFYNGLDTLVAIDLKNTPPVVLDEQRIRISVEKGTVEMRTENSADLHRIISVLTLGQSN